MPETPTNRVRAEAWMCDALAREERGDYHGAIASADLSLLQWGLCDMRRPDNQYGAGVVVDVRIRCMARLADTLPVMKDSQDERG